MNEEKFVAGVDRLKLVQSERSAIKDSYKEEKGIASAAHKAICKDEKGELKPFDLEYEESSKVLGEAYYEYQNSSDGGPVVDGVKLLRTYDFKIHKQDLVPKMFWMLDEKKIKETIKATGGDVSIAGIENIVTHKLSVSGKGE